MASSSTMMRSLAAAGIDKMDKLEPVDGQIKKDYEQFKLDLTRQAVLSLRERIPAKIIHFNNLVSVNSEPGTILSSTDMDKCYYRACTDQKSDCESGGKKVKLPDGRDCYTHAVPAHKQIYEQLEGLKVEASELIETLGQVKLWIQLNVPRIEDGNNFGVGIQEEAIQELGRVEDWAFNLFDAIFKYYMARAKLMTKVIKYPSVADYWEAIRELDEKEWLHAKFTRVDMRNNYSMLYDLLSKNWEKVVKPKSEDVHHRMTF